MKTRPSILLLALLVVAVGVPDLDADPPGTPTSPADQSTELDVRVESGSVSIVANGVSRRLILEELARGGHLTLELESPLDEAVSLDIHDVSMATALQRLLQGKPYLLSHADSSTAAPGRLRLWVFDDGSGRSRRAAASEEASSATAGDRGARFDDLSRSLADGDRRTRLRATQSLGEMGGEAASGVLSTAALADLDPAVREEAVYALSEIGDHPARTTIESALMDPSSRVREAALQALTDLGGDESAWALAPLLHDEDPEVRQSAVYALGEIGGEAALDLLERALSDEHEQVRGSAEDVLDELAGPNR